MDREQKSEEQEVTKTPFELDTSRYTVILKDTSVKVSNQEVQSIYAILKQIISSINKTRAESSQIDIARYKFQIVPLKSNTGQKTFWINSFCNGGSANWKVELYQVADGGKCFFNAKVNLTNSTYFDLIVNSSG